MEQIIQEYNKDFSVIFKEIEKFHQENPSFIYNLVSEEELEHDEEIRVFGEICQEINSAGNNQIVYMTFS
ncbi:MAG: hypothetical protein NTY07_02715 [Bacteroidia bacterium]|nr:hypothetical protein [Bacteroidia bacterium]